MSRPTYAADPADATADEDRATGWLMGRVNYEARTPIPYSDQGMKLDRMRELLRRLGDPQDRLRVVHVAGTKGKGSTSAMVAAACEAAGLRTGVYSSPHLESLRERFAVSGAPCSPGELVGLVNRVRPVADAIDSEAPDGLGPTFFDLTTAMAIVHFADCAVDAAVLEVGLGGRLDSTNVVTPAVCAVTSISLDHTRLLGETRAQIAAEKAGIFKPGVPAVSGVADPEAGDVIERIATEQGCPFWRHDRDFSIVQTSVSPQAPPVSPSAAADQSWVFTRTKTDGATEHIEGIQPALPGQAQADNAAVALATLGVLADTGWNLSIDARRHGVNTGRLPARMERIPGEPLVVIDGAHNDASAAALADALDTLCDAASRERRVLVAAMSDDKDKAAVLEPLARRFGGVVATRYLENPRAAGPEEVAQAARQALAGEAERATDVTVAETPAEAWQAAKRRAGKGGVVVFAGSLLFAAEARRLVLAERAAPLGESA